MDGARYVGDGAWLPGVPARDLSAAELERFEDAIRQAEAAGQRLYVLGTGDQGLGAGDWEGAILRPDRVAEVPLTAVQGIGAKTALALAEAGYGTLAALASADPALVDAQVDGVLDYVTVEKVRQWQVAARSLLIKEETGD